jgi:hypothetical protein
MNTVRGVYDRRHSHQCVWVRTRMSFATAAKPRPPLLWLAPQVLVRIDQVFLGVGVCGAARHGRRGIYFQLTNYSDWVIGHVHSGAPSRAGRVSNCRN